MKTLLILLAILLIAAGVAVGLMNILSPGTVIVGLNLDVAATLFTGGCVLLGLGVVSGNLSAIIERGTDDGYADDYVPATSTKSDLPDFMAPASAAGGAAAAATGSAAFGDAPGDKADTADDVADHVERDVEAVVEDAAGSNFRTVSETASEAEEGAADTTVQVADKVRDDLSSFFARAPEDNPDPDADTPPVFTATPDRPAAGEVDDRKDAKPASGDAEDDASTSDVNIFSGSSGETATDTAASGAEASTVQTGKADPVEKDATASDRPRTKAFAAETPAVGSPGSQKKSEETATASGDAEPAIDEAPEALPQEEELFVVEERVIRKRPARLLSDGTVEAETDEGWMRFENVEHVEEYLDAMKATA